MSTFLVNAAGLALMGAIVWWFWLSSSADIEAQDDHSHHH